MRRLVSVVNEPLSPIPHNMKGELSEAIARVGFFYPFNNMYVKSAIGERNRLVMTFHSRLPVGNHITVTLSLLLLSPRLWHNNFVSHVEIGMCDN
jgi:hypothetical protein